MARDALGAIMTRLAAEGSAAWPAIAREYDHFSTREFLEKQGWSEGAIEMFGWRIIRPRSVNRTRNARYYEDRLESQARKNDPGR